MDFIPQPGSQHIVLASSNIRELLYEGTRGPGKTITMLMDFAQHCEQGYGPFWRGILFRQTYKQLSDVIAKSRMWYKAIFGDRVRWRGGSDHSWTWDTGEQLLLRQAKVIGDYDNYHGHEYPWICWEELTNWANPDLYEAMFACNRSSYRGPVPLPRKVRATCNPFGVGHNWVKSRFITGHPREVLICEPGKPERIAIHGHLLENKVLMESDPTYIQTLRAITSEPKRKAWLHGSWDIVAGGMFDDVWDYDTHVLQPFQIPRSWVIRRAFDWGSTKPFSVGWWARADGSPAQMADGTQRTFARGSLIRIGEWYGTDARPYHPSNSGLRKLATEIADGIREREQHFGIEGNISARVRRGPADSSIFDVINGKSIAQDFVARGVHWAPSSKGAGSRKNGWERIRVMLGAAFDGEDPGLFTFNTCRLGFLDTVPQLPRDEKDMDDVDTDAEDHCGDETRYMVLHNDQYGTQEEMNG